MPAIAPMALIDSGVVTRDFNPISINGNLASFRDSVTNGGVAVGDGIITLSIARPSKTSRVTKVRAKLTTPILDAVTSELSHAPWVDVTFMFPEKTTVTQRTDILAMLKTMLLDNGLESMIVDGDSLY